MSSGPILLPSYHQPPKAPQSVVVMSAPHQQHQTHPMDNPDINKNNTKIFIQQYSKPSTGNVLSIANTNPQIIDNKRKHDCKLFVSILL
jgi:hypothetical protein